MGAHGAADEEDVVNEQIVRFWMSPNPRLADERLGPCAQVVA